MTEIATVIVGVKFRPAQAIDAAAKMRAGDEIRLNRDVENKYDAYAVECHFAGHHIGFIPRQANPTIARMIDAGTPASAVVTDPARIVGGRIITEPKILVRLGE